MRWLEKKEVVFRRKDKAAWRAAREALRAAGFRGVTAGSYEGEAPVCGCGARLDHRDFGSNGRIDRRVYYIRVPQTDAARARALIGTDPE